MVIITDTFIPYEFNNKFDTLKYLEGRCMNIKKSLRRVEKDTEHLRVRCPVSGDYLDVIGLAVELDWLDNELKVRKWYRD